MPESDYGEQLIGLVYILSGVIAGWCACSSALRFGIFRGVTMGHISAGSDVTGGTFKAVIGKPSRQKRLEKRAAKKAANKRKAEKEARKKGRK